MAFLQEWAVQFKTYNRNIRLAILANILTQIGLGAFMIVYNFYIRELGLSQNVNGEIIARTSLATALILVPAGILSDRVGRKKVMAVGVFIGGIILTVRSLVEMESFLLSAGFATGISLAFFQVSIIPWLAENSGPKQRIHLFSLHSAVMMAANVIGNLLGGGLTDFFSLFTSELLSIRYTLVVGSLFYFAAVLPILKMKEKAKPKREEKIKPNIKDFI